MRRLSWAPALGREHLVLAAVVALTWGTMFSFGNVATQAMLDVVLALGVLAFALATPAQGSAAGTATWAVAVVLVGICGFLYVLRLDLPVEAPLTALLVIAAATVVLAKRPIARAGAGTVAAASAVSMMAVAWQWGTADIDVFDGVQQASAALLYGHNPYSDTFAALVQIGPEHFVLQAVHFDYLPGAVLLAAPARLIGDVRVMSVVAFAALIFFVTRIALDSPNGRSRMFHVLALSLASPLTLAMVHWAWLDVYSMTGLAGWLALRKKHHRWSIALLAIAFTVKPTVLIALVPAWLWSRRARSEILLAAGGAVAVILPFALMTGFSAFFNDVIGVYGALGLRYDALTLSAWWYELTGNIVPVWISLSAGAVLALAVLRLRPTDLSDVLIVGAFLSTAAFLLAKQAFLNYYFIPFWLLVVALAGRGTVFDAAEDVRLPVPLSTLAALRRTRGGPAERPAT